MSAITAPIDDAMGLHAAESGKAHGDWLTAHQRIAAEYHAKSVQLARWRVQAMAAADEDYRKALESVTSDLLNMAEAHLRDFHRELGQ